jgi:hypothetical protein
VVTIPYREAHDCIVSLLTDPRVDQSKLLFFNKDPLAPPPSKVIFIEDINTGEAYLKSYEKWISKPKQVLFPIIFYIDATVTGQFSDLPVTALKMTLGIFDQETRDQGWAWRELAWIPQVRKESARGKKLFKDSKHLDSQDVVVMDGEGQYAESESEDEESAAAEESDDVVKAQDFHSMLSFGLESFVKLQESGFIWDQVAHGQITRGIEYIPFVVNVKCDTEEGDLLCGKFTVRTKNVKHLCRYCHCPTDQGDNPLAKYKMKTQGDIQKLIDKGDLVQLKAISQQNIQNAWYKVRFHAANDRGIHGATPSEMLHALLLGIFKYLRNIFFVYMGESSTLAQDINGLCKMYGKLLSHQSDRDLPYTNFAKGIQKGRLMAKQFRGVLLVMAAVVRSESGRKFLMKRRKFGKENGLRDWSLLLELMLEWEAYLCEPKMKKQDVMRLEKKHRFIMYIIRNVAKRAEGMGLKVMKFHAISHLVEDIRLYTTPSTYDTGANESHWKETKYAAILTQRKEALFSEQTAKRLTEFLTIDLAYEEIETGATVWEHFDDVPERKNLDPEQMNMATESEDIYIQSGSQSSNESGTNDSHSSCSGIEIRTGGTRILVFEDSDNKNIASFEILGRSKHKNTTRWVTQTVEFLVGLQNQVCEHISQKDLPVLTEHKRGNIMFRGHPNHRGEGAWKDWAIMDWGHGWGKLPSRIWCFVDLRGLNPNAPALQYGGTQLKQEVYAVVEVATYDATTDVGGIQSDLFIPLTLEVGGIDTDASVTERKFYLADVDTIVEPCIVIPNIGDKPNAYLQVKPRRDWSKEFVSWLKDPHNIDDMVITDNEQANEQPKEKAKVGKTKRKR